MYSLLDKPKTPSPRPRNRGNGKKRHSCYSLWYQEAAREHHLPDPGAGHLTSPWGSAQFCGARTSKPLYLLRVAWGTDWAEQRFSPQQSTSHIPVIFFPRLPAKPTGNPASLGVSQEGQAAVPLYRFQAQEQPAPVLTLTTTQSLASGKQVKAASGGAWNAPGRESWPAFLAEVILAPAGVPDLPLSWYQPCPKFLKLSPFSRLGQLQDGYFCFFFLRGAPAQSLPVFPPNKNEKKRLEKTR